MHQTTLEEALTRVEANANDEWKATAVRIVTRLAESGYLFTTDDVWGMLEAADVHTHEPRALGAIMRSLAKNGKIMDAGGYRNSTRPECHQRPVKVWVGVNGQ